MDNTKNLANVDHSGELKENLDFGERREFRKIKVGLSFGAIFAVLVLASLFGAVFGGGASYFLFKKGIIPVSSGIVTKVEKVTLEENSAIIDAVKKVSPSVVSILAKRNIEDFFFGQIFQQKGGGTGFVVTSDGLIMTNKHVVSGFDSLKVITSDGASYEGTVVAMDPINDIALVKIGAKNLPVVDLGDSDSLVVGQRVIAIGNALGEYQNTVTTGIISARKRSITASDSIGSASRLEGMIQTDAAINPGNSGGPLINIEGQVVGINTAIDSQGESIGFAIPINIARTALTSFLEKGKIVRPMLGIRYIAITKDFATLNKLTVNSGALVSSGNQMGELAVVPGSPADKAGLRENDIITAVNNEKIDENTGLVTLLSKYQPGDEVELTYLRGGEEKKIKVKLGEMKTE